MSDAGIIPEGPVCAPRAVARNIAPPEPPIVGAPSAAQAEGLADAAAVRATPGERRVLGNAVAVGAASVAERLTGLVSGIYTRRVLGAVAIGQLGWTAAVVSYFQLVINPGLETIAKREVARRHEEAARYAASLLSLQLVLASVAFGLAGLMALWHVRGPAVSWLLALQAISLLLAPFDFTWLLYARERMTAVSWASVASQVAQLPAVFLLLHAPRDVARFAVLPYPFRLGLIVFVAWYATRHRLIRWRDLSLKGALAIMRPLIVESIPLGLSQAAILIYYNVDAVFLGFTHGDRVVGLYTTAYKLMLLPTFLFGALWSAYFPQLSRAADDAHATDRLAGEFLDRLVWLGFPIAALTWAAGRHLIVMLYGPEYRDTGPMYEWLSLNLALIFLNCGLILPFITWGRQRLNFGITAVAALANLLTNLYAIPRWGARGAVATTIASELIVLMLGAFYRHRVRPIQWVPAIVPPATFALVLGLLVRGTLTHWPAAWLLPWGAGVACWVVALLCRERNALRPAVRLIRGN